MKQLFEANPSLKKTATGEPTAEDLQVATGVILLDMAGRDEDYAPDETRAIFAAIKKEFGIEDNHEVMRLLEKSDKLRQDSAKFAKFIEIINQQFNNEQRTLILSMVWKVVMADGKVDRFEERFAEQIQNRLKLTVEEAEAARAKAEKE